MTEYQSEHVHTLRPRSSRLRPVLGVVTGLLVVAAGTAACEPVARTAPSAHVVDVALSDETSAPGTAGRRSAKESAETFLAAGPVSRAGLLAQLEFEEHSTVDATWAVDQLSVDWDEQAARSAASYLETMPFSRDGLLDQLLSEGFTQEQAEYGIRQAGL